MSVIGTLAVNVVAKTNQFAKDMQNARKTTRDFGKEVDDTSKMMRTFGRLMTGGLIIGGAAKLTGSLMQTAQQLDHVAKTAAKLGIATDQLQGLTHAAELSGVSSNKLEMAMQRLTRRTAEAAGGTGEAVKAFAELGLNAAEMNKLSPDQLLGKVADAMQGVTGESDKVRLAFKLFDAEGVDLVNMLKDGSAGLEKMKAEAAALGLTVSGDQLAKVEKFNDEMTRLRSLFDGAKMSLLIDIAPAASEAVEGLRLVLDSIPKDIKEGAAGKAVKPLFEGPNERNSIQYRMWDSVFRGWGAGMGGNDAAMTDAEWNARARRSEQALFRQDNGLNGKSFQKVQLDASQTAMDLVMSDINSMREGITGEQSAAKRTLQDRIFGNNNITNKLRGAAGGLGSMLEAMPKIDQDGLQAMGNKMFFQRMAHGLGFGVGGSKGDPRQMFDAQMGAGGALEYGSAAAFSALRKNMNPNVQISKDQLAEQKRHTVLLTKIAEQEPMEIISEGL